MNGVRVAGDVLRYVWTHPANRDARCRAVARAMAFQFRGRLGVPTLATIGDRSTLLAEPHHHAESKVLYANPPDWSEMLAWRAILRPGDVFVDVGSNAGAYALWAAETGAEVIAVEPDPAAAARLRRNIARNGYDTRVRVVECALGAASGTAVLSHGRDTTDHLLLAPLATGRPVRVETLDDLVGERHVAGVKVDVEGAERLVLVGATRALSRGAIAVLQVEWNRQSEANFNETRAPLADLLRGYGYTLTRPNHLGHLRPTDVPGYGGDVFAVAPGWSPTPTGGAR